MLGRSLVNEEKMNQGEKEELESYTSCRRLFGIEYRIQERKTAKYFLQGLLLYTF